MNYYLIGKTLKHSYSSKIHNLFNNSRYQLKEIDEKDLLSFLENKEFAGLNVTIPYKSLVIDSLDYIDKTASLCQNVNTVVNHDNRLYGYNSDFFGFLETLKYYNIQVKDKNCLILGTGSSSNTIKQVLQQEKAKNIFVCSRTNGLTYRNLDSIKSKIDIIINCTPYNMYPNNQKELLFSLDGFDKLQAVIDLVYNPLNTNLLIEAKKRKIKAISGLYMLVYQAYYSELLFGNNSINKDDVEKVFQQILLENLNVVFIGMPSSGKSKLASKLAKIMKRKWLDVDSLIEKECHMTCAKYLNRFGEKSFRQKESKVIQDIKDEKGVVISTGGGSILNDDNMYYLKENGIVIFIDKDIDSLIVNKDTRPLIKNKEELVKTYNERYPLYLKYQDMIIQDENVEELMNKLFNERMV